MRVHVDMKLCQSHGMCVYMAPEVFELDDDDLLRYSEQVDTSRRREVEEAIKACPAHAISLPDR
jgi:ferredoxin